MLQKSAIYIDKRAYACYNKVTPKREAGLDMIAKKLMCAIIEKAPKKGGVDLS